jgi:hypothetical protein
MWREGEGKRGQDRNHPWAFGSGRKSGLRADLEQTRLANSGARPVQARSLRALRPLQALGTIEARSKVEMTGPSKA